MNKRILGFEKEHEAVEFLENNGYEVLKTNFYCHAGEIDIIARDEEYLCFIEVKYRQDYSEGYPEEAVDFRKIRRISKSALFYMNMAGYSEYTPCRFDVVSILGDDIKLIKNAFEAVL